MTKWDLIQLEKVEKALEKYERKQHENEMDLYYRYQGKTTVKTLNWREAVNIVKDTVKKLRKVDTETEPLLFDCLWYQEDPLEPVYAEKGLLPSDNLFRSVIHKAIIKHGIKEGDIETWLRELTTKS